MNAIPRAHRSRQRGLAATVVLAGLVSCTGGRHYDATHDQILTMLRENNRGETKMVFLGATSSRAYYSVSTPCWFTEGTNEDIYSVALNGLPADSRRPLPPPQRTELPNLTNEFYRGR